MRVALLSDVHLDERPTVHWADAVGRLFPLHGLVLLGDIETHEARLLAFLDTFRALPLPRLLVLGNHDIWDRRDSWERYERLSTLAAGFGFHSLDREPLTLGGYRCCGSMGWYDLSFRDRDAHLASRYRFLRGSEEIAAWDVRIEDYLRGELQFVEHKLPEGWPDRLENYVPWERAYAFNQRIRPRPGREDLRRIVRDMTARLEAQLQPPRPTLLFHHHVPYRDLLRPGADPSVRFGAAFMGSTAFGELIDRHEEIRVVAFGHTHQATVRWRSGRLLVNPGAGRLVVLEEDAGRFRVAAP